MKLLYLPFIIQGIVMVVDEFWAHEKRGLPRWEQIGHPLDSATVLLPYLYILNTPYSAGSLNIYIALAVFSCLFITKDEMVHATTCSSVEHWLHSLLFILHPLVFLSAGILWRDQPSDQFLFVQPVIVATFMLYQILRWSIPWARRAR